MISGSVWCFWRCLLFYFLPWTGGGALYFSFSGEDTSLSLRLALWESTIAMIEEHPLLGVGWGNYWLAYPEYNFFIEDADVVIFHAHDMYLHIPAEVGIPGGIFTSFSFSGKGWCHGGFGAEGKGL